MRRSRAICPVVLWMVLATSVTYGSLSDNFDDNSRDPSLWSLSEQNHSRVWVDETNQRLELRSTGSATGEGAVYLANGWGFLTTDDFSFRVSFHNAFVSDPQVPAWASAMLGLTKGTDLASTMSACALIGAAWDTGTVFNYSYFAGGEHAFDEERTSTDGTLYLSYDAGADELYLSPTGYGKANASATVSGIVKGQWHASIVRPFLGGSTDVALNSGDAYLDNFVVDSGTVTGLSASYTYDSTDQLHIWDIAGPHDIGDPIFSVTQDTKGKLGGTGELNFVIGEEEGGDITVAGTYTITGQITQTAGVGNVKMTIRAKGMAARGADTSKFTGTMIVRAEIDPATSALSGTSKESMTTFRKHWSRVEDIDEVLTDEMDGTFTLALNIAPSGKKATATAVLTLNGHATPYNFSGKGTFNAKRDQYVLTLTSPEKLSLKLYITASTGEITKLTGKALGQNLRATNILVTP